MAGLRIRIPALQTTTHIPSTLNLNHDIQIPILPLLLYTLSDRPAYLLVVQDTWSYAKRIMGIHMMGPVD